MSLHALANHMASRGRNGDSMLVHMTPGEVQGLQALALKHGGSLTVNPDTGLVEAGFLSKILPMIAGLALNYFLPGIGAGISSALGITGASAGAIGTGIAVGGASGLAKGSLKEGFLDGLSAFGGAGIGSALTAAGTGALSGPLSSEAGASLNSATSGGAATAGEAVSADQAASRLVGDKLASTTPAQLMSKGFDVASANPTEFLKNNWQYGAAALSPLAGGIDTATPLQKPAVTGSIAQKIYDPYTQTYTEMNPVNVADWQSKNMQFSDVYKQPMQAKSGGIVALNHGGMAHFDAGGFTNEQVASYIKDNNLDAAGAQKAATAFKISPEQLTAAQGLLSPTGNLAGVNAAHNAYQAAVAGKPELVAQNANFSTANNLTTSPTGGNSNAFLAASNTAGIGLPALDANLQAYARNVNPTFINTLPGATGGGLDSLAEIQTRIRADMAANGVSEADMQRATGQTVAQLAAKGVPTKDTVVDTTCQTGYHWDAGTKACVKDTVVDTTCQTGYHWDAKTKACVKDTVVDTGTTCQTGYHWDAGTKSCVLDFGTVTDDVVVPSIGKTQADTFSSDPTLMGQAAAQPGIAGGVSGTAGAGQIGGGTVRNQDTGMIVESPRIPGIPVGGFTGAKNMRDVYTTGGGSLGYTSPVPASYQALLDKYAMSSGSDSEAMDKYLRGKGPYPYKSSAASIQAPYSEATLGMPAASNRQYIWDRASGKTIKNMDYAPPSRDATTGNVTYGLSANEATSYLNDLVDNKKPLQGQDLYDWAKANKVDAQTVADAYKIPVKEINSQWSNFRRTSAASNASSSAKTTGTVNLASAKTGDEVVIDQRDGSNGMEDIMGTKLKDGTFRGDNGVIYDKDGKKIKVAAAGGMMGYAVGGLGSLGSLGGYSDGGQLLRGPGNGVSDDIPAVIGNKQPARLADGEFVVPARIVSELGNGSTDAGARSLYKMMDRIQHNRRKSIGKGKVATDTRSEQYLPA